MLMHTKNKMVWVCGRLMLYKQRKTNMLNFNFTFLEATFIDMNGPDKPVNKLMLQCFILSVRVQHDWGTTFFFPSDTTLDFAIPVEVVKTLTYFAKDLTLHHIYKADLKAQFTWQLNCLFLTNKSKINNILALNYAHFTPKQIIYSVKE